MAYISYGTFSILLLAVPFTAHATSAHEENLCTYPHALKCASHSTACNVAADGTCIDMCM